MEIEQIRITELKPATYNPRKISQEELEKLIQGIREFGMVQPIIINADFTVIGGHQRLKAADALNMETVPCLKVDLPVEKEKALNLALNKIGGAWDQRLLDSLLRSIIDTGGDISLTGFDDLEISKLLGRTGEDVLMNQIASEAEYKEAENLSEKLIQSVTSHILSIARSNPQELSRALMVIINKGRGNSVIFLVDPSTRDVVNELKRYAESGIQSPLEKLTEAVWR